MKKILWIFFVMVITITGSNAKVAEAAVELGLVAHYSLDVNIKNRFNQPQRSQYFDGLYDFTVIDQDTFISGNVLSVSFWIKASNRTPARKYFIRCSDFGIWQHKDRIGLAISQQETASAEGTIPSFEQWTHFLGTFDGSYIRTYINGHLTESTYHPGKITGSKHKLTFGYSQFSYWQGALDDFRIYDRVLSQAEIIELADARNTIQISTSNPESLNR